MTLAYVFWHRPATGVDPAGYEAALDRFHQVLGAPGGSCALALEAAPWLPGDGAAYEDWYLVPDWAALGALNHHAVTAARAAPHDAAARASAHGIAGVYALLHGAAGPPAQPWRAYLAKPPGMPYPDFHAALAATLPAGTSAWQRQMTLGPAGEYVVAAPAPLALPGEPALAQSSRPVSRAAASAASS
jgi:hypothetical protein